MHVVPSFLRERGFQYAIVGSFAWHAFWLFAVAVDFSASAPKRSDTRIYFLGPVLTDESFNTLVSLRPEISQSFYRTAEDLAEETLEPELHNLGHQPTKDAVSVPKGQNVWNALRGVLRREAGAGPAAPIFYEKLPVRLLEPPFPLAGGLQDRELFLVPDMPGEAPSKAVVFEITVAADGKVVKAEPVRSSGDARVDGVWRDYLKGWQFVPAEGAAAREETGRVTVGPPETAP